MPDCPHTLYLIRHGETDWNAQQRLQGRQDIALNATGHQQAINVGACLSWLNLNVAQLDFFSSPLCRAQQTMCLLRQQLGLAQQAYHTDDRLIEISFGRWEGLSWQAIRQQDPEGYQAYAANPLEQLMPDGENYRQVFARVANFVQSRQRDSLIVAHSVVLKAFLAVAGGVAEQQVPELHMPQNRILIMRQGRFIWLQGNSMPDGSHAMYSQTAPS